MMHKLEVALGERSYPIYIGAGLLEDPHLLTKHVRSQQVLIVTNDKVGPLYLEPVQTAFHDYQCDVVILPDGEQYKTWESVAKILDILIENRHRRTTTLLALGGGVVSDITGFTAACYQRGVDLIHLPTTLLAQVDASVGGKTAINHPRGKNMIGAFHQPRCVIVDTNTLHTLPGREFSAGLAEIIKAALISDADFYHWLEMNIPHLLLRKPQALTYAIEHACGIKAAVVSADETEKGMRALLNFGHTFGHAIEHALGYRVWLHGEAVAVGMVLGVDLSVRLGWLSEDVLQSVRHVLTIAQLPTRLPPNLQPATVLSSMAVDKKKLDARLRLVLLRAIGQAEITPVADEALLLQVLQDNQAKT
ncbi:MAG: 3-dehydroquinate synthase [Gammaproteobacteria bacterium]